MANEETQETYHCDALVVGSGCAGLSAAVTAGHHGLKVLVVEKEPRFGGTTARSGGWLWIPGTSLAKAWGIEESPDQAKTYLRHEAGNSFDAARVDAFLTEGPKAVDFFTTSTAVRFDMPLTFPDYHAEAPGGAQGGRSMVTRPFDAHELGDALKYLGSPLPELTVFGMMLGSGKEIVHFMRATRSLTSAAYVAKRLSKHAIDVMRNGRGMTLTNGNALAGRLAKSAFDLKIPLWLNSPVRELIVENGAVHGAIVVREGRTIRVNAKRGVVLACGGFPHDVARRQKMFPHAPTGKEHYSPGPVGNTGDGLRLAESAGGRIDDSLPNAAAWVPVSVTTRKDGSKGVMPHFIDRAKPGVIAVMADGRRFANEGNSYHDFVQAMIKAAKPGEEIAAHLICDHETLRKYGLGCVPPRPMPLGHHLKTGYLKRGATLSELAAQAGIDAKALETTVAEFNSTAVEGRDPAFGKGSRAYNRYQGDALHGPNPCIAPIQHGPFYAIKMVVGDLGTYAGIRTDANARALDADGQPIAGLYAAGNDMASIMGGNYPGAGITLGPALTFGYIAGKHIAGSEGSSTARVPSS
ncbi:MULTISPECIES: FAD-dependent oxidoreductase [Bradyrhizobium]|uniref:FAD-dependent oxidoreductase n=1 Tax=Bradyrhizobium TaxID=374 RepID=UPI0004871F54|nr:MULTISPECIES: FAD-dependent oxidoreductase [Bradyrhizobium]MCS3450971.1 succinate dehydrogenase/fumarate reductase flavoprotein subunit [Bradyrhizobium elkanii]MCS3557884.1 succinate dehydrogenase/fumarate reductase flavoprotein subunit [Bradyrhizobium elkanii]MCW2152269.1 succinate dehydrogenase/fumarate reductase flavoprotein subunit [Bradyrhizobium elkanii]MCW2357855.1 succinate dehydrogenase/fumarate reductase flavoprotein subunit [Bradyrhizobium elkanii]MCW2376000.1 succinate dehydroge